MQSWRAITEKQIRAKGFLKNVVIRNQQSFVFIAWAALIAKKKKLKQLRVKMEKQHILNTKAIFMYDWIQASQEVKISKQMDQYYMLKRLREIVPAWRAIKDSKNQRRRNVFLIREQLEARPALARPLLVMKNLLLFRAFNKLIEGAALEYDEE